MSGPLNELMGDEDIVINAAGSMPGDLQALWQARSPVQYHLEYGYSCMGYELPASLGAKMARPQSEVVDHRRRHLPDGPAGDRHDRLRARQGDPGDPEQPRLVLDRLAVGVARLPAVRHQVPDAQRGH